MPFLQDATVSNSVKRFHFHGSGMEFFGVFLVNIFLTAVTGGIYYFWAEAKVKKYLYENTEFEGEFFSYHGTGMERFIGLLKAIGILGAVAVILWIIAYSLNLVHFLKPIISVILLFIVPFVIIGRERYRLSRSSYRNIRFRFTGKYLELLLLIAIHGFITVITLGIYSPWLICKLYSYLAKHSYYGDKNFHFEANPVHLLVLFFTFAIGIIALFALPVFFISSYVILGESQGTAENILNAVLSVIWAVPIFLGLYLSIITWFNAAIYRFYWGNVYFLGNRFSAENYTALRLVGLTVAYGLLTIFTFGIGAPFAFIALQKFKIVSLRFHGDIDFSSIRGSMDAGASALADGFSDAADGIDAIGTIFGG
ncbi:MAG: YjgN family protein [Spirochaetota bacterium]